MPIIVSSPIEEYADGVLVNSTPRQLDVTVEVNSAVLSANPQTEIIDVLLAAIAALQVVRDTANATINGAPASYIKDVAQQQQVIARRCLRVARTVYGVLDSTTGI